MSSSVERLVDAQEFHEGRKNALQSLVDSNHQGAKELLEFIYDSSVENIKIKSLPVAERLRIHNMCEQYSLESKSEGPKKARTLNITKPANFTPETSDTETTILEKYCLFGYLCLKGPYVERVSERDIDLIPDSFIKARETRDGPTHHITILNRMEIKTVDKKDLLALISENVKDDWVDLGLGKLEKQESEAYFRVLDWPSANKFRKSLGLSPADFHITLGFLPKDIHGACKGPQTIIKEYDPK